MNIFDYISIFLGALILFIFFILVIRGKRIVSIRTKYILFTLIFISIAFIVLLNSYYEKEFFSEIKKINLIEAQILYEKNDSLIFTQKEKKKLIDSLNNRKKEIEEILEKIQKQEKIIGSKTDLKQNIEMLKQQTDNEINRIRKYNEIIDNSTYANHHKGIKFSGETSHFIFYPPLNTEEEYLDFAIKFIDNKLIDEVAVIYIEVYKQHTDGNVTQIFEQYYKPQNGVNLFRLKNYFTEKEIKAHFGFFWKKDFEESDYPRYEKVTFSLK